MNEDRSIGAETLCSGSANSAYLRRLKLVEGQVRGIARMIEDREYCIDILNQVSAANAALRAVAMELLKEHLRHSLVETSNGQLAQEKFEEAMAAVRRLAK